MSYSVSLKLKDVKNETALPFSFDFLQAKYAMCGENVQARRVVIVD